MRGLTGWMRVLLLGAAALAAVGLVVSGIVVASRLAHARAVSEYAETVNALDAAHAEYREARDAAEEAMLELESLRAVAADLVGRTGEPIPSGAIDALRAALDEDATVATDAGTSVSVLFHAQEVSGLSSDEIDVLRDGLEAELARLGPALDAARSGAATAEAARDALADALAAFRDAVADRARALLEERGDAAEDSRTALLDAVAALERAAPADLTASVDAALATAAAVVRSSDLARLPPPGSCWGSPDDVTVLINKHHPLCPLDYEPPLRVVDVGTTGYTPYLRPEAADAFEAMLAAMLAEAGLEVVNTSSFRSYSDQVETWGEWASWYGEAEADRFSARPGHSEHQSGLAIDVTEPGGACAAEACFGGTPQGQWLAANAWRFGWIVRYPDGFEHVTGYVWEPWHLRYVGTAIAAEMHERGIATLEDYYGTPPAPAYP